MSQKHTRPLSAIGVLLLTVLCWGLAPVANRYLLMSLTPQHLVVLRLTVASLLFIPITLQMRKQRWNRKDILLAIFCSFANILGYNVTVTYGLAWVPASLSGLLIASSPLWIALLSHLIEREPFHWTELAGLTLGIGGVAILVGWTAVHPDQQRMLWWGMALVLFASLMWSIYTVAVRPLSRKYGAPVCTGITTIVGTLPLVGLWDTRLFPVLATLNLAQWLAFALLALGSTVIATILWNYGVAQIPGAQAGIFLNLLPIVSMCGGSLFLQEQVSPNMLFSGIIIVAGVVVTQLPSFMAPREQQTSTHKQQEDKMQISQ